MRAEAGDSATSGVEKAEVGGAGEAREVAVGVEHPQKRRAVDGEDERGLARADSAGVGADQAKPSGEPLAKRSVPPAVVCAKIMAKLPLPRRATDGVEPGKSVASTKSVVPSPLARRMVVTPLASVCSK